MSASLVLEPPVLEPARFKWSATRLKMLLQCPRQYRFAYVDELPRILTAPQAFGQTMHEVLCAAHEDHMTSGMLLPVCDLILRFDEVWKKAQEKELLYRLHHPAPAQYATLGHEMLRVFYALNHATPPPLAVELAFEVESGEHLLCGIVDRVDEVLSDDGSPALAVVDYKTGQKKPSPRDAATDLQLTVYAFAVREALGLPVERVEFHFLRDGLSLPSHRDEHSFGWLLGEVLCFAARTVERGVFPPRPGFWCNWCDFKAPCEKEGGASHGSRR